MVLLLSLSEVLHLYFYHKFSNSCFWLTDPHQFSLSEFILTLICTLLKDKENSTSNIWIHVWFPEFMSKDLLGGGDGTLVTEGLCMKSEPFEWMLSFHKNEFCFLTVSQIFLELLLLWGYTCVSLLSSYSTVLPFFRSVRNKLLWFVELLS